MSQDNGNRQRSEADRYEQAATETLEMLDWCIGYFDGTRKGGITSRIASGRQYIKEHLMQKPEVPLPSDKSGSRDRSAGNGEKSRPTDSGKGESGQSERYKQAATEALELLDWSIGFLVGTRKESIAKQLAQNRKHIREDLMREPAEPVPTSKE